MFKQLPCVSFSAARTLCTDRLEKDSVTRVIQTLLGLTSRRSKEPQLLNFHLHFSTTKLRALWFRSNNQWIAGWVFEHTKYKGLYFVWTAVGGSLLELSENQKRWMVVGICLNKVLAPALRKYIGPLMLTTYNNFKSSHSIHLQTHPTYLKKDKKHKLNYKAINNNHARRGHPSGHDYKVASHVDMAKLYLVQTHMAKFSTFDESCDPSATLGILCTAPCFSSVAQASASSVRRKVRNEWAHCNFADWAEPKFTGAIDEMKQLVRSLGLPKTDTDCILDTLDDWKDKGRFNTSCRRNVRQCGQPYSSIGRHLFQPDGEPFEVMQFIARFLYDRIPAAALIRFSDLQITTRSSWSIPIFFPFSSSIGVQLCMGSPVDKDLLKVLYQEVSVFAQYVLDVDKDIETTLQGFCTKINAALQDQQGKLDSVEETMSSLENKHDALERDHAVEKRRLDNLEEDQASARHKIQRLETEVQSLVLDETKDAEPSEICQLPNRNEYFSGREQQLQKLEEAFGLTESSTVGNKVVGISGLGGCGKTTLAAEYAWCSCSFYTDGIYWISAEDDTFFRRTVTQLAFDLGTFHGQFDQLLLKTLSALSQLTRPFLLIIDNADEHVLSHDVLKVLCGHWRRNSNGHILVTTRRKADELQEIVGDGVCITLGCYTPEEALDFMRKRTGRADAAAGDESCMETEDADALNKLVRELGGLPLALEQAGSHIKALNCTYSDYLSEFRRVKIKLIEKREAKAPSEELSKSRLAVHTTWEMNFDYALQQASESGHAELISLVIDVSAYLDPDDIPCDLIKHASSLLKPQDEPNRLLSKEIVEILTKFSLFQSTRHSSLSVHRLVQQVIRSRSEERSTDVLLSGVRMLTSAFRNATSPAVVLTEADQASLNEAPLCGKHLLRPWSRLASNAVTLKEHLMDHAKAHPEAAVALLYDQATAKLFGESAIYFSMHNQQLKAFESQKLMLLTLANAGGDQLLTDKVPIPLTDRQRILLHFHASVSHEENPKPFPSPIAVGTDVLEILSNLRSKGNEAYRKKDYQMAISVYSKAIKTGEMHACRPEDLSTLYSNRSQCYLNQDNPTDALHDADQSVRLNPQSCKGYFRRALAMKLLFEGGKEEYKLAYLASAAMAVHFDSNFESEAEREFGPFLRNKRVISTQEQLLEITMSLSSSRQPSEFITPIIILRSGQYEFFKSRDNLFWKKPILRKSIFVGAGHVEISNVPLMIQNDVHFENIVFDNVNITVARSFLSCVGCTLQNGPTMTLPQCLKHPCPGCRVCKPQAFAHEGAILGGPGNLVATEGSKLFVSHCTLRQSAGGVMATGVNTFAQVRCCKIHDHYQASVEAREGASLVVEESELSCSKYGEGVCFGPNAGLSRVRNNKIHGNAESWGVVVGEGSHDVVIEYNSICRNGKDGIKVMDSASMVARKNEIFENNFWGIDVEYGGSEEISQNIIHDNKCGGIRVFTSQRVILAHNEVTDHNGPGILHSHKTLGQINDPITTVPPVMVQNIELRNEEGKQYPELALISNPLRCSQCGKEKLRLLKCTVCRIAHYCDKKCQKQQWKVHKRLCKDLRDKFSRVIDIPPLFSTRNYHPDLTGIKKGPKPDRNSSKQFIVKIQTFEDIKQYTTKRYQGLTLYDRSTDLDIWEFRDDIIHNVVVQCGILGSSKSTGKKVYCFASFEDEGKKLRIHLDELAPFQKDW